jgi:hypothetical protein
MVQRTRRKVVPRHSTGTSSVDLDVVSELNIDKRETSPFSLPTPEAGVIPR